MDTQGGPPSLDALGALRDALAAASVSSGDDYARDLRARLLAEVEGHLIPRVTHPHAPVLVAVAGPTGSGKSTLINSLAGRSVSPAGALRPTTRAPVLVHRAEDRRWFPGGRRRVPGWSDVHAVMAPHLPAGVALLDIPDVESTRSARPGNVDQLLAAADVWIFVTTAMRYADAAAWEVLSSAGGRTSELAVVLDRVYPDSTQTVHADLLRMLKARGLTAASLIVVRETTLEAGRLPAADLAPVRRWLQSLSAGGVHRGEILRRTLANAVAALADPLAELDQLAGGDARLRRAVQALGRAS